MLGFSGVCGFALCFGIFSFLFSSSSSSLFISWAFWSGFLCVYVCVCCHYHVLACLVLFLSCCLLSLDRVFCSLFLRCVVCRRVVLSVSMSVYAAISLSPCTSISISISISNSISISISISISMSETMPEYAYARTPNRE
ncbi:hypothetical protein EX30DRAFT_112014 [Ascodesmis nigricans]|uniref:REJ domain-containing protein n=1 Tax=Ascodesmis nigricans TaxID=341454 RepID=A0A4S2MQJ9_9PEZI|nr:hypothetical protein EX30DRAFT_112014 [Ascodesmis nigricans]